MSFKHLNLDEALIAALEQKGYVQPTPIQEQAIPAILEGKDIFGCAQTGTGKTAAFALPALQLLSQKTTSSESKRPIRALILAPTRELALQISENFSEYGKNTSLRHTIVFGGVSQYAQTTALRKGVDILIATPGRLLDLMQQGHIALGSVEFLVLDEADRMLDMGFINDVKRIISKIPVNRQTLFFSATASADIMKLAKTILRNPVHISITPVSSASTLIEQSVYHVIKEDKRALLRHILEGNEIEHALVFTRTKRGADRVAKELVRNGIKAAAIHGDKSQNAREKALDQFKKKQIRILVATDVASRGIDIEKLSHVINFELPETAETYVHRIGRTGRAGSFGKAISFCSPDESDYLKGIIRLTGRGIPVISEHPFVNNIPEPAPVVASAVGLNKSPYYKKRHMAFRRASSR
jgi:ATP-dependent RNA helicase RhlE